MRCEQLDFGPGRKGGGRRVGGGRERRGEAEGGREGRERREKGEEGGRGGRRERREGREEGREREREGREGGGRGGERGEGEEGGGERGGRGIYGDGKSEGNSPGTIDDIHHIIDGNAALCYVRGYDHLIRKTAVRGRGKGVIKGCGTLVTPSGTGAKTLRWSSRGIIEWQGSKQYSPDPEQKTLLI